MNVVVKEYDIIYEFIEYLEDLGKGMIVVEEKEVMIGKLEVLGIFFKRGKEMIF
jgi:translation initiation factor IF-2